MKSPNPNRSPKPAPPAPRRRWRRWAAIAGGVLLVLAVVAGVVAFQWFDGKARRALRELDTSTDPEVRLAAVKTAAIEARSVSFVTAPRLVRTLTALLDDQNPHVRGQAVFGLMAVGDRGRPVRPRILQMLEDPSYIVRRAVVRAYGFGEFEPSPVHDAEVVRLLRSATAADRRRGFVEAVQRKRPRQGDPMFVAAVACVADADPLARGMCLAYLWDITRFDKPAAEAVFDAVLNLPGGDDRRNETLRELDL